MGRRGNTYDNAKAESETRAEELSLILSPNAQTSCEKAG
jgi:hypothetical protein